VGACNHKNYRLAFSRNACIILNMSKLSKLFFTAAIIFFIGSSLLAYGIPLGTGFLVLGIFPTIGAMFTYLDGN